MGPTLYDVVGALRDASPSMLKRAYRARALRMHPAPTPPSPHFFRRRSRPSNAVSRDSSKLRIVRGC